MEHLAPEVEPGVLEEVQVRAAKRAPVGPMALVEEVAQAEHVQMEQQVPAGQGVPHTLAEQGLAEQEVLAEQEALGVRDVPFSHHVQDVDERLSGPDTDHDHGQKAACPTHLRRRRSR